MGKQNTKGWGDIQIGIQPSQFGQSKKTGTISEEELDRLHDGITDAEFADADRMLKLGAQKKEPQKGRVNAKKKQKAAKQIGFSTGSSSTAARYKSCADSHPPLPIKMSDGTVYEVYGGSATRSEPCSSFDVFVGLDHGMQLTARRFPWNDGEEFLFPITDMLVPKDLKEFNKLIQHLMVAIVNGKKVFIGCIGGHGRTGLVLAALLKCMTGEEDAITYVRDNYCQKAVESSGQVDWLNKHFGIKKVKGSKSWESSPSKGKTGTLFDTDSYPKNNSTEQVYRHMSQSDTMTTVIGRGKKVK